MNFVFPEKKENNNFLKMLCSESNPVCQKIEDTDFMRCIQELSVKNRQVIAKLEALLRESSEEKEKMRETILALTEKVAALTVKVEFLQKDNN